MESGAGATGQPSGSEAPGRGRPPSRSQRTRRDAPRPFWESCSSRGDPIETLRALTGSDAALASAATGRSTCWPAASSAGACPSRAFRRSRPRRRRVQSVGAPPCPKPERGDAARRAAGCRKVTSGENRCPWGAGTDPTRHSAVPATPLLRMPDRRPSSLSTLSRAEIPRS